MAQELSGQQLAPLLILLLADGLVAFSGGGHNADDPRPSGSPAHIRTLLRTYEFRPHLRTWHGLIGRSHRGLSAA